MDKNDQNDKLLLELEDLPPDDFMVASIPKNIAANLPRIFPRMQGEHTRPGQPINWWFWPTAGGLAGLLGWVLAEIIFPSQSFYVQPFGEVVKTSWLSLAIPGAAVGLVFGDLNAIAAGKWSTALKCSIINMFLGLSGGAIGGFCGQLLYMLLRGTEDADLVNGILYRSLALAASGLMIGFAQGIASGSVKKMLWGLLGGLVGGALGGVLFDLTSLYYLSDQMDRGILLITMGIFIGAGNGFANKSEKGD